MSCLNLEQATRLVFELINKPEPHWPDKPLLAVKSDSTIERSWGWVFFYNTASFIESGNALHAMAGNAPYIVNRNTGEVHVTGTAYPIEHYINQYEQELKQSE